MFGLQLRDEFRGKRLKGTAIELANDAHTGATELAAEEFLRITYPTHDVLKGLESLGQSQGRPVVIIGERGLGKSHLMATSYHALNEPSVVQNWLTLWRYKVGDRAIASIGLRPEGMLVIAETLHRQRYKFLWDILFDRHPYGEFIRGKWEGMGDSKTDVPSDRLILEMLRHTPTALLLDEFQTWYDGLTNTKQFPWRNWAFNFIQILSEIAKEYPDLLVLVVSVRNGDTDAYQQIHRVNPIQIDFKAGGSPERIQQDRRRMLLYRLFDNRLQVSDGDIASVVKVHTTEYNRLMGVPLSEQDWLHHEFIETWPFAPHLLRLLEDQVLIATDAQETRDLIRILANLFKSRGEDSPILTAADFRLDDDGAEIAALLDSVASQYHRTLRDRALRNITAVREAMASDLSSIQHLEEILSSLWLRSIAVGNLAGAEPQVLQVDITKDRAIDDNGFQVELAATVENSFNIHRQAGRYVFRDEENPQAKLLASARNDKLFTDGSDQRQLALEIKYVLSGTGEVARNFRVIVLPQMWQSAPWEGVDQVERPEQWDSRIPLLVIPEMPERIHERLGVWLKVHLQTRRNTVRFLLPVQGLPNAFADKDLLVLARAVLKAKEWAEQTAAYAKLHVKYRDDLRGIIKQRFARFAILSQWNFIDPAQTQFHIEPVSAQGDKIPDAIEEVIVKNLFVPEDFEDFVLQAATQTKSLGKLLEELQEPRAGGLDCIPWLGETHMKEYILKLCARGKLAIDVRSGEYLQALPGENEEEAWRRIRAKLPMTGRYLDQVKILLPVAVPSTAVSDRQGSLRDQNVWIQEQAGSSVEKSFSSLDSSGSQPTGSQDGETIFNHSGGIRTPHSSPATSPLNLIGKLESWGITAATPVESVTVKVSSATGAQLREILKKLPDGLILELALEKVED